MHFWKLIVCFCLFTFLALTKVYERANSVVSYNVSCPTWLHKYIIGKKGSQIQKLSSELPKVSREILQCPAHPDSSDDNLACQMR